MWLRIINTVINWLNGLLELETLLNLVHRVGRLVQKLELLFRQLLLDDVGDSLGSERAGQGQEHFLLNSMLTLSKSKKKKVNNTNIDSYRAKKVKYSRQPWWKRRELDWSCAG